MKEEGANSKEVSPEDESSRKWEQVVVKNEDAGPTPRSLHASAVVKSDFYVFGGFDGASRTNDLYRFNFVSCKWSREIPSSPPATSSASPSAVAVEETFVPAPRDRHSLVSFGECLYLFGGFVENKRVNEFYRYDTTSSQWAMLAEFPRNGNMSRATTASTPPSTSSAASTSTSASTGTTICTYGQTPSPRHSHAMTTGLGSLWLFGGFDGMYKNDLYEFKVDTLTWTRIMAQGIVPRSRYRTSLVCANNSLYLFAGHDGHLHMNDLHIFNILDRVWTKCEQVAGTPAPRDSHIAVVHEQALLIFGGSSGGCANNDFMEFCLTKKTWSPVAHRGMVPKSRFCHVGVVHEAALYIFGGYDGSRRLGDFHVFRLGYGMSRFKVPYSTLYRDLANFVAQPAGKDIEFIVATRTFPAHSIFCVRCPYFHFLLSKTYQNLASPEDEAANFEETSPAFKFKVAAVSHTPNTFVVDNASPRVFFALLMFLYCDTVPNSVEKLSAEENMELYEISIEYRIPRLRMICLREISEAINTENVARTLQLADSRELEKIREMCLSFIIDSFNLVSTSRGFEELGKDNFKLVFEILQRRQAQEESNKEYESLTLPRCWRTVTNTSSTPLTSRSLHAAAVHKHFLYVFGGYDGKRRLNDFVRFSFTSRSWSAVKCNSSTPSPRDRHTLTLVDDSLYLCGGFYDSFMLSELYKFDTNVNQWELLPDDGPSPRHSHAAVAYMKSLYIFGGYDGDYQNDLHEFNTVSQKWQTVLPAGTLPRKRYRATCVVHSNSLIVYGGHDGKRHLSDVCLLNLDLKVWSTVETPQLQPPKRDSHISVVKGNIMFVFGGSSGTALNDFWALDLKTFLWFEVPTEGMVPAARFCHVGELYNSNLYILGGYNGCKRLEDFNYVELNSEARVAKVPSGTLIKDLKCYVNNQLLSDIRFKIGEEVIHAHRIMLYRCEYFHAMLHRSSMVESRQEEVILEDISVRPFKDLLNYVYTDEFTGSALELFPLADRFGVERLKLVCESKLFTAIHVDNAATILLLANAHSSPRLREKALKFILDRFDMVSKTEAFEAMGRSNIDLLFEVLRLR